MHVGLGNSKTVTSSGTTANTTFPTTKAGRAPKVVRLVSDGEVYITLGQSGVTTDTDGVLVNREPLEVQVQGYSNIAYIEGSTAAVLNITALEC